MRIKILLDNDLATVEFKVFHPGYPLQTECQGFTVVETTAQPLTI
jgi:hypothetical protein